MHYRRARKWGDVSHEWPSPEYFFEKHVDKAGECWIWTGKRDDWGYGVSGTKSQKAHRVAWELANGPIPEGLLVLHRCDNPPCVRIDHLFIGSNADNTADMIAKGRARHPSGEANPNSRLTRTDVDYIRTATEAGPVLSARFGVSTTQINRIRRGGSWNH